LCRLYKINLTKLAPFFSLVFDAGSKGTRFIIFKFDKDGFLESRVKIPEFYAEKVIHKDLSFFALKPEGIRPILDQLIDFGKSELEDFKEYWKFYPIYLKGTAGLRDLIPEKRDIVMTEVAKVLEESPFYFKMRQATVISGEQEAAFSWLTVNTYKNTTHNHHGESYGILDLGGASLQVSFVPQEGHYVLEHFFPMDINKKHPVDLYAKSYLHYGLIEANRRLNGIIISDALSQVESLSIISNPCFFKGMKYEPDFSRNKFVFPMHVNMTGSGNFRDCRSIVLRLFEKNINCFVKDCTFDGIYQPRTENRKFLCLSTFARIAKNLGIHAKHRNIRPSQIKRAAISVCDLTYSEVTYRFGHIRERDLMCFTATYVYVLLTYGLGFTDQSNNLEFYEKQRQSLDWALGSMIWEINRTPPKSLEDFLNFYESLSEF
jgi:apyrase